jgi:hypothetical protein
VRRGGRTGYLAAALALAAAGALRAQTGAELAAQGVSAYRALEFDAAAALLRRGLGAAGTAVIPDSQRPGYLIYLGATELFRNRRDSAAAAFRQALQVDPRHRPDPLVFPPEVANTFDAVRRLTLYVRVAAPADTAFLLGDELYRVRLYASALHDVTVSVAGEDGRPLRRLYAGPVGDSLDVRWDGLDSTGRAPLEGRLVFEIVSRTSAGRQRTVRLPLATRVERDDTLALPGPAPDSLFLPERTAAGPALRALGAGLLAGAAAAVLPSLVAEDGRGTGGRIVVSASLGLAGIVGFFAERPGRPLPDHIAANAAVRAQWQRDLDRARAENARRRRDVRLRVTAGVQRAIEGL